MSTDVNAEKKAAQVAELIAALEEVGSSPALVGESVNLVWKFGKLDKVVVYPV